MNKTYKFLTKITNNSGYFDIGDIRASKFLAKITGIPELDNHITHSVMPGDYNFFHCCEDNKITYFMCLHTNYDVSSTYKQEKIGIVNFSLSRTCYICETGYAYNTAFECHKLMPRMIPAAEYDSNELKKLFNSEPDLALKHELLKIFDEPRFNQKSVRGDMIIPVLAKYGIESNYTDKLFSIPSTVWEEAALLKLSYFPFVEIEHGVVSATTDNEEDLFAIIDGSDNIGILITMHGN